MDFLDEASITARSGDGGKGCVSFRRERYIPRGGPDGGDGGDGGSIFLRATGRRHTLAEFRYRRFFTAKNGAPGKGKNQTGKNGQDVTIEVPVGTIVYDQDTKQPLVDLTEDNQEIRLLRGGRGGKGNQHFATSTNRTPRFSQPGLPGQEKKLRLSLKFLADVGLIGLPNSGKSTLLSRLTMSRPKIGPYPFTTVVPQLGVLIFDDEKSLIVADIPGLIEGASEGRGLGQLFLKHIERTKLLLHLIDATYEPGNEPLEDFQILREELACYDPSLAQKDYMVLINKIDIHKNERRDIEQLRTAFRNLGLDALPISALTGEGLEELKLRLAEKFFKSEE